MNSDIMYKNREVFTKELRKAFKNSDIKLDNALLKAVISALSEKDETADICQDTKRNPEPDPDLRDTENVPYKRRYT